MPPLFAAMLTGIIVFCSIVAIMQLRARSSAPRPKAPPAANRRKAPRVPLVSEVDLFWQDVDASHKSVRAKGIEMSEHGASVRSSKPIVCNSVIYVRARQVNFEGTARVRRCTKKGLSYIIGMEIEGSQAKPLWMGASG